MVNLLCNHQRAGTVRRGGWTAPRSPWVFLALALLSVSARSSVRADDSKVNVLIVDGAANNPHDWAKMTAWYRGQLEKSGRFAVDVSTAPRWLAPKEQWDAWRPDFSRYQVVLSCYNGRMWPEPVWEGFLKFVRDGGGAVIVHCGNNSFPGYPEYDKMIGLGWRDDPAYGNRVTVDDVGKVTVHGPKEGPKGFAGGASHGDVHPYRVVIRDPQHPITQGLPPVFMHAPDELYDSQRGPAANMHILATAFSERKTNGSGAHEPLVWWIPYGQGKVITNVMGHVDLPTKGKVNAARCAAHTLLVLRASEWAATGKVAIPVPKEFPTADNYVELPEQH